MPNRNIIFWIVRFLITTIRNYSIPILVVLLASYILDAFPGWLPVRVIKWVFYVTTALVLPSSYYFRRYALKRWGGIPDATMLSELAKVNVKSVGFLLNEVSLVMIVMGLVTAGSAILFGGGWISLGLLLFAIGWSINSRLSTPPLVVFFATSRDESQRLTHQLVGSLSPNRVVHLLALRSNDPSRQGIEGTSQRTVDEMNWQQSAESLMKLSRIIVLDCRHSTESLIYEAKVVLASNFVRKTIFIGNEENRCELFQQVVSGGEISLKTEVYVLPEKLVLDAIRRIIESPNDDIGSDWFLVPWRTVGTAM